MSAPPRAWHPASRGADARSVFLESLELIPSHAGPCPSLSLCQCPEEHKCYGSFSAAEEKEAPGSRIPWWMLQDWREAEPELQLETSSKGSSIHSTSNIYWAPGPCQAFSRQRCPHELFGKNINKINKLYIVYVGDTLYAQRWYVWRRIRQKRRLGSCRGRDEGVSVYMAGQGRPHSGTWVQIWGHEGVNHVNVHR